MIWYPYEQMKTMKDPYKILDAEGVHLYTKDQKLIDSISSWWCMIIATMFLILEHASLTPL